MSLKSVPSPDVMPVDSEAWGKEIHLSNFVNAYYQYRDLTACCKSGKILIVGPGQGLGTHILRWRGYEVSTFDIDNTFAPDHIGSVHDLKIFSDKQFDAVIVSHVLEHLAEPYLDESLKEISRVGNYALVYLPVAGRHFQLRFAPGVKGIDISLIVDFFNYFHKPDGITPRYCQGQHFWEVGMRGFRRKDLMKRMNKFYEVLKVYRNRDWNPSLNFVLKPRSVR